MPVAHNKATMVSNVAWRMGDRKELAAAINRTDDGGRSWRPA